MELLKPKDLLLEGLYRGGRVATFILEKLAGGPPKPTEPVSANIQYFSTPEQPNE